MDYVKLATRYYRDPALLAANKLTRGRAEILFLRAMAHCGGDETGGHVAADALQFLGVRNPEEVASVLVSVQLWIPNGTGWRFRSWDYWQSEHDALARRRKSDRERQARKRAAETASPPDSDPDEADDASRDVETLSRDASRDVTPYARVNREESKDRTTTTTDQSRSGSGVAYVDAHVRASPPPPTPDDQLGDPPGNPSPNPSGRVTETLPDTVPTRNGGDGGGLPITAQTLVAEWVDHCSTRPPGRTFGQVARLLDEMLREGLPPAAVRTGLARWHTAAVADPKGKHPSLLPSFVHAAANTGSGYGPPTPAPPSPGRGKPGNPYLDDLRAVHGVEAVTAMTTAATTDPVPLRALPGGAA